MLAPSSHGAGEEGRLVGSWRVSHGRARWRDFEGRDWTDGAREERLQGGGDPEPSHPGGGAELATAGRWPLASPSVGRWVMPWYLTVEGDVSEEWGVETEEGRENPL